MEKDKLEGKERIIVWVANLINPLIAGFLFYYSWRKKFPNKAKQANKISFVVFVVYMTGYIIYKFAGGFF